MRHEVLYDSAMIIPLLASTAASVNTGTTRGLHYIPRMPHVLKPYLVDNTPG